MELHSWKDKHICKHFSETGVSSIMNLLFDCWCDMISNSNVRQGAGENSFASIQAWPFPDCANTKVLRLYVYAICMYTCIYRLYRHRCRYKLTQLVIHTGLFKVSSFPKDKHSPRIQQYKLISTMFPSQFEKMHSDSISSAGRASSAASTQPRCCGRKLLNACQAGEKWHC